VVHVVDLRFGDIGDVEKSVDVGPTQEGRTAVGTQDNRRLQCCC